MSTRVTQRTKILIELQGGDWIPLPRILEHAAQYCARINELRRAGHVIENRTRRVSGQKHSWYRLVSSPEPTPSGATE